jgi:hypothetical protein
MVTLATRSSSLSSESAFDQKNATVMIGCLQAEGEASGQENQETPA